MEQDKKFIMAQPTLSQRLIDRIKFNSHFRNCHHAPTLNKKQETILNSLKHDGFVILPEYLNTEILTRLQQDFQQSLEALEFDTPCLAQAKIDLKKHREFIDNYMYGTPEYIESIGAAFNQNECKSYQQVIKDFNPSTLSIKMLQHSQTFQDVWLNPFLLSIIANYMGLVPQLVEAYVRRNFPAPYRTMNHFWHRDLNHHSYLLKMFVFLNDCTEENGPHEYIKGSCTEPDKISILNGKRYYTDEEVDAIYPPNGSDRVLSTVKAGTIVIEDTRGLHRANLPKASYRDLGFAVFMPISNRVKPLYAFPEHDYNRLDSFQKLFVPDNYLITN